MSPIVLAVFEASLKRCEARPDFFDTFYEKFLASSPEVASKFAHTDFGRQKAALRTSLHHLLLVARDPKQGPDPISRTSPSATARAASESALTCTICGSTA